MTKEKTTTCSCDGGSIECPGDSCGCHCNSERCIFTCGDTLNTGFSSNVTLMVTKRDDTKPDRNKDKLKIRSNGLPLGQVALLLNKDYVGEVLVPIGRIDEITTLEIKGSLEEICYKLGFTLQPKAKA